MATKKPTGKDKIELELKRLSKLPGNKTCVDCPEKVPNYADVTHFTFVCTKCSGLHRELQYKVKGIGMSNFTEDELVAIEAMGNTKFNESYLARYDQAPPNANDLPRYKEFLKQKYVDKKWFIDKDRMTRQASETTATLPPPNVNPLSSKKSIRLSTGGSTDLFDTPSPAKAPSAVDSFDPFGSNSSSTVTDFDPFSNQSASAASSSTTFDAFGSSSMTSYNNVQSQSFPNFHGYNQPIPFIKTSAEPPPEPVKVEPPKVEAPKEMTKNFSAFDDLVVTSNPAPGQTTSANPFDQHTMPAAPAASNPGYSHQPVAAPSNPANHYNPNPYAGYPQQNPYAVPPNQGYGAPQPQYHPGAYPQHYNYPPASAPYGAGPGYAAAYGYSYPPPPQQFNAPPAGYPGPQQTGQPAYHPNNPPQNNPSKSPVLAAAPDPFSDMTGLAWSNLQKAAPPQLVKANLGGPSAPPAPAQTIYPEPQASEPVASNPFDMFG